jgi:hypothetical protein
MAKKCWQKVIMIAFQENLPIFFAKNGQNHQKYRPMTFKDFQSRNRKKMFSHQ